MYVAALADSDTSEDVLFDFTHAKLEPGGGLPTKSNRGRFE